MATPYPAADAVSVQLLKKESESITVEFSPPQPMSQGTNALVYSWNKVDGSGSVAGTHSTTIEALGADGVTWFTVNAAHTTAAGQNNCRWYPKMRVNTTITKTSGTGPPVAATARLSFVRVPYHGEIIEFPDGLNEKPVRLAFYQTAGNLGVADPDMLDRPDDRLWYFPITGPPGGALGSYVAEVTAMRDALLTWLGSRKTEREFRVTAAANGATRIDLTHDVRGTFANSIGAAGSTEGSVLYDVAWAGGAGTETAVDVKLWVNHRS